MSVFTQQTSLDAYRDHYPKIGHQQAQVLAALKQMGTATDKMLSRYTGLDINVITPRRGELVNKGYVAESHKTSCKVTGKTAIWWEVVCK